MIKKFKAQPILVRLFCDNCGQEMICEPYAFTTFPATYPHRCHGCNTINYESKIYPYTDYEEIT